MTIYVKRVDGSTFQVLAGGMRLQAELQVRGKARVHEADSGAQFDVHEVDGQIVLLTGHVENMAASTTMQAISKSFKNDVR